MSLEQTKHSKSWNAIPKRCKYCVKAIYVQENNGEILYQCSIFGQFKRECKIGSDRKEVLPTRKQITG